MKDTNQQLDDLLTAVEDKKKNIQDASSQAKAEFLEALDSMGALDSLDNQADGTDSLNIKLTLAKLKIQEEWDEIEEKLENLGSKAKKVADYSEEEVKERWDAAKKMVGDVEKRISKFFSRKA